MDRDALYILFLGYDDENQMAPKPSLIWRCQPSSVLMHSYIVNDCQTYKAHTLTECCLFREYISVGFSLSTYSICFCVFHVGVYLPACVFCPFPDHMSSTVPDIWWPYLCLRSLTVLRQPWEPCRCVGCSCMCVSVCATEGEKWLQTWCISFHSLCAV